MHNLLQVCHVSANSKLLCCRWNVATLQYLMAKNSPLKTVLVMHVFINNFPSQWQKNKKLIYQAAEGKITPLCIWNQLNIVRGVAKRFVWRFSIRFSKAHNLLNSEKGKVICHVREETIYPPASSIWFAYIHLTQETSISWLSVKSPV